MAIQFRMKDSESIERLVYIEYACGKGADGKYETFKRSIGITIHKDMWSKKNKCAKPGYSKASEFNQFLKVERDKLQAIIDDLKLRKIKITKALLNSIWDGEENNDTFDHVQFVSDFARVLINKCESKEIRKAPATIQTYRNAYQRLLEFEKKKGRKYAWKDINKEFYEGFTAFLRAQNLAEVTVGKVIIKVKTFINDAFDRELHNNLSSKKKYFSAPDEKSGKKMALFYDELEDIANIDFNTVDLVEAKRIFPSAFNKITEANVRKLLNRERSRLLAGCKTGLRYSDNNRITNNHIIKLGDQDHIKIRPQKTWNNSSELLIPVPDNFVIEKISNQSENKYLKVIAFLAGGRLRTMKQYTITKGGEQKEIIAPRYMLVTTHTKRRTFASHGVAEGRDRYELMEITGHKKESSFNEYLDHEVIKDCKMRLNKEPRVIKM